MSTSPKTQILAFLILTFTISWIEQYFIIQGGMAQNMGLVFLLMWTPGLVGMALSLLWRWRKQDIGFRLGDWNSYVLAYLVPAITGALVLASLLGTGLGSFELSPKIVAKEGGVQNALIAILLVAPVVNGLLSSVAALGEEIGWRGFLHANLLRSGVRHPFLITGIIWAVWHWPLILFSDYATSPHPGFSVALFTIMVVGEAVFLGWLRARSGSIFPAALGHGAHNLFIQGIYPAFLKKGPWDAYFGGESGVFIVIFYSLFAIYIYRTQFKWGIPMPTGSTGPISADLLSSGS